MAVAGIGAAGGAYLGGAGGGTAGAVLGSVIPGFGNVAGALGGAALGATGGAAVGGSVGYLGGIAVGYVACSSSSGNGGGGGGAGGTQVTSKTLWKDGKGGRIDVENPNPGQRIGQIHYQDQTGKYLYNPQTQQFDGAPNRVNQLLNDPKVSAAIQKGLRYLGQ